MTKEATKKETIQVEVYREELVELLTKNKVTIKGKDGVSLRLKLSSDAQELAEDLGETLDEIEAEEPEEPEEEEDEEEEDEEGDEDEDEEEDEEPEEEVK